MSNKTLVILAAGIGSRFKGGIKQLELVKNNKKIIELNINNAIKAGFNKVVFVIRDELKELFDTNIIPKLNIEYCYAYQKIDEKREKPWGSGHAIVCLKDIVKEDFCLINADDYYTEDSFIKVSNFFDNNKSDNMMVAYKLKNTVFVDTGVNRGICEVNNNLLNDIIETYNIKKIDNKYISDKQLDENSLISMNIWGFRPYIIDYFSDYFKTFLDNINNYQKDEYLIGDVIKKLIKENKIKVYVDETDSLCIGITYKEVVELFNKLINKNN